ncbi:MAG: cytochrome c biogenesis protein CcdA [Candidatus Babeliales bacterium]|jgi:thiol:disulfide interchange protein DsbD
MDILVLLKQSMTADASMAWILLLSFLSGVLISFTPCIYPMIPITIGIMQTQATRSLWRGLLTGLFYVLGLAMVYATLGFISATTSVMFGQWTSSPWFTFFIVLLFLYLALSLFGFYEITIPAFFTRGMQNNPSIQFVTQITQDERVASRRAGAEQSSTGQSSTGQSQPASHPLLKSFLLGLFAGTVASPCLTPALAMLLTLVAEKGNPLLGFFAMFLFAFGMGFLLMFIGMFSASLNVLPRAGEWMNEVKKFFGFVMLGACVYIARNVLWQTVINPLYAVICVSASIYYFYSGYYMEVGLSKKVKWFLGICFAVVAMYLFLQII